MQITTFLELAQVGVTRKSSCLFSPSSPHSPQKSAFWPRKSPIFELPDLEPFFTEPAEKARVYAGLWCFQNLPLLLLIFHQIPYAFFDSKCGRSAQNRRESSNLSISAMRSASEKLVDLFPFYGETADRFCSMGATMSCSMAAADCFFVAYCRCP